MSSATPDGPGREPRPHRPRVFADLTAVIDAAGGIGLESRAEIAAATAAVLVRAGRDGDDAGDDALVALADRVGLDTLAELWREADPVSLPGALWALYVLRQWCRTNGDEVARLWRAGEPVAAADSVVAGVDLLADVESVRRTADAVLGGVYHGDVAVALERAAAMFRVVAAGRRELAGSESGAVDGEATAADADTQVELAERNERAAADLTAAAARWRAGTLR